MTDVNAPQAVFWEELAPSWLEGERHTELVASRFGARAMDRLDLAPGQRVLDIGCGSGPTTIELARRVGPDGGAVGADIAPSMVAAARQRAEAAGVGNVEFVVADAQTDQLGQGFDAAFSQFGVMFFADAVSAFDRIRQTLRPGGSLSFACWQDLFANEWMFVPGSAVVAVTGVLPPMPGPGEPGPFSLAEPGRAAEVLAQAGFDSVEVESMAETVVLSRQDLVSLSDLSRHVGPVREALRDADQDTTRQILEAVDQALEAKVVDDELRLSAAAFIVHARA